MVGKKTAYASVGFSDGAGWKKAQNDKHFAEKSM